MVGCSPIGGADISNFFNEKSSSLCFRSMSKSAYFTTPRIVFLVSRHKILGRMVTNLFFSIESSSAREKNTFRKRRQPCRAKSTFHKRNRKSPTFPCSCRSGQYGQPAPAFYPVTQPPPLYPEEAVPQIIAGPPAPQFSAFLEEVHFKEAIPSFDEEFQLVDFSRPEPHDVCVSSWFKQGWRFDVFYCVCRQLSNSLSLGIVKIGLLMVDQIGLYCWQPYSSPTRWQQGT